jgi:DNA modification methylase
MPAARILIGDVRTRLADIPDNTIQACITSPPYWGLRDYGTATWEGGDSSCDHLGKPMATKANINRNCGTGNDVKNASAREFYKETCGKCGARRIDSQIGLEQTPDEYVAEMVAVFREVRRVLKDDGVLWLNLGDSYATVSGGMEQLRKLAGDTPNYGAIKYSDGYAGVKKSGKKTAQKLSGLKHKDVVGIPWRVAFALQADGWWLRQDIIWHKPNPMPESVTDRCTKAHEYLFMLTKSAKYYFNNQAIQEDAKTPPGATWAERKAAGATAGNVIVGDAKRNGTQRVVHGKGVTSNLTRQDGKRNRRSVWTIPTKPFRGAHFAVMPEALVEPCILASSRQDDTILDPFTGSGTVAVVSLRYDRNYIGTELNPDYVDIARQRITDDNPMFNELTIE